MSAHRLASRVRPLVVALAALAVAAAPAEAQLGGLKDRLKQKAAEKIADRAVDKAAGKLPGEAGADSTAAAAPAASPAAAAWKRHVTTPASVTSSKRSASPGSGERSTRWSVSVRGGEASCRGMARPLRCRPGWPCAWRAPRPWHRARPAG